MLAACGPLGSDPANPVREGHWSRFDIPIMTTASVSIVIPTYNRAGLLPAAIASVQAQTYAAWELIVVDDGSNDATQKVVAALAAADPRIRLADNTGRHGPAGARNAGLAQCRTPWVAFLDSDDRWQPEKLTRFMAAAAANPEAVLIGSDYWMVDRDTGRRETMLAFIAREMMPWWENDSLIAGVVPCAAIKANPEYLGTREAMLATQLGEFLWVHTSSAMVRLDPVKKLGAFDESLVQTEDIRLWLQLSEQGPVVFIPEALATYDITGRDVGTGERYATHDRDRKPTLYSTRLHHLELTKWLRDHVRLTAEQHRLLRRQTIEGHRRCANAARGTMLFGPFLFHRLAGSHRFRAILAVLGV
jgi:glycosyltransferase involved in cell wall biosynthesis